MSGLPRDRVTPETWYARRRTDAVSYVTNATYMVVKTTCIDSQRVGRGQNRKSFVLVASVAFTQHAVQNDEMTNKWGRKDCRQYLL